MAIFDWRRLVGLYGPDNSRGSTGLGSDFPESAGERERGKFRPSQYPRLDTVAVVDDDGNPIGTAQIPAMGEVADQIRRLRLSLVLTGIAADIGDLDDLQL